MDKSSLQEKLAFVRFCKAITLLDQSYQDLWAYISVPTIFLEFFKNKQGEEILNITESSVKESNTIIK